MYMLCYNTKTKVYPDGMKNGTFCSKSIFFPKVERKNRFALVEILRPTRKKYHPKSFSLVRNKVYRVTEIKLSERPKNTYSKSGVIRDDVLKRSIEKLYDIVCMNQWDYFLTITIDPKKMDRSDPSLVMKKLSKWLDNKSARNGLRYVLVPELHSKGGIHCHALISGDLTYVDSGTVVAPGYKLPMKQSTALARGIPRSDWRTVYNVSDWKYGFSTAIPTYGDNGRLAGYITKYLTKDSRRIFGKSYWSSRDIKREPEIEYSNTDYLELNLQEFRVPCTNIRLKYRMEISENDCQGITY